MSTPDPKTDSVRRIDHLSRLQAATAALSQALTPAQVAETVVARGMAALGARAGLVARVTAAEGNELEILHARGFDEEILRDGQRVPLDAALPLSDVVRTSMPLFIETRKAYRALYPERTRRAGKNLRAAAALPLVARGEPFGGLYFAFPAERAFPEDDREFVASLAHQGEIALERARLYEAEQSARREAEGVLESIGEMFYALDAAWRFTYINRRTETYWEMRREDYLGKCLWDVSPEARGSLIQAEFERAVRERKPVEFEIDLGADLGWFQVRACPSPAGLSVYFSNITARKQVEIERERTAEEKARLVAELQVANARQRRFLQEMLFGLTDGRLRLCATEADLPEALPPLSDTVALSAPTLRLLRRQVEAVAERLLLPKERLQDLETAVGEAAMNAVRHGGGDGTGRVHGDRVTGRMQVWVWDQGAGIAEELIHRATLDRGWTTGGFGQGFYLMRSCADRVYLLTGPGGTTVVLEQERIPPEPAWLQAVTPS